MKRKKKLTAAMPEPRRDRDGFVRCRVCGCTYVEACNPPCSWADGNLCSTCEIAVQALIVWQEAAHRPSLAALLRELKADRERFRKETACST